MSRSEILEADDDAAVRRLHPVIRELRPHIATPEELASRVTAQRSAGYRLIYAEDQGVPVAAAGFRVSQWLAWGKTLYVDDLIVLESHRGRGFADALMEWMQGEARRQGCAEFHLDSGTHRLPAHRFYHRMGLAISSFHFSKKL
ncbi:MAG: GNAT family N-acetyltransferase [Alphaproteobacteria bacterium]|nr:GNAT family N-acetyltransferase [Alphaproteobacteria bacterium]